MNRPYDAPPDEAAPPMPTEADLRAAMAESAQDVAAGRTVPLAAVLADLDAVADRIEARTRARQA
jgi:hypothetical protein